MGKGMSRVRRVRREEDLVPLPPLPPPISTPLPPHLDPPVKQAGHAGHGRADWLESHTCRALVQVPSATQAAPADLLVPLGGLWGEERASRASGLRSGPRKTHEHVILLTPPTPPPPAKRRSCNRRWSCSARCIGSTHSDGLRRAGRRTERSLRGRARPVQR